MFRIAIVCCMLCVGTVVNAQEAQPPAKSAARVGDATASGGVIVTGSDDVSIEGQAAAREGDMTTNPTIGMVPGVGGVIREGGQAGAGDQIMTGASSVIIGKNVFINGQRAATAAAPAKPIDAAKPLGALKPNPASQQAALEATQELLHLCSEQITRFMNMVYAQPKSK